MRTVFFLCLLALGTMGRTNAQGMPVYDNTNFISLGKQIIEAGKQTSQLLKTVQFLKEQKERIEKVSNVVRQLRAVHGLTQDNQRLFTMVRDDLRDIFNSPYIRPDEVQRVSDSFNGIIENAMGDMEFVAQILSSGLLKMTDADRTKVLREKEVRTKQRVAEIQLKTKRYREIIAFREMQAVINGRKAKI